MMAMHSSATQMNAKMPWRNSIKPALTGDSVPMLSEGFAHSTLHGVASARTVLEQGALSAAHTSNGNVLCAAAKQPMSAALPAASFAAIRCAMTTPARSTRRKDIMAHEDETFHQQCERVIEDLKKLCSRPVDGKPCGSVPEIDYEDCCTTCQAARTIYFARKELPSPEAWARSQQRQRELSQFQINALGGYG
jgi:hypothetical protein